MKREDISSANIYNEVVECIEDFEGLLTDNESNSLDVVSITVKNNNVLNTGVTSTHISIPKALQDELGFIFSEFMKQKKTEFLNKIEQL